MRADFKIQETLQNFMRRCGYFLIGEENGEFAFARPMTISKSGYPRFHAYIKFDNVSRETSLNLHLDQKKPVYKGSSAHAGEYDGDLVLREMDRIKSFL